MTLHTGPSSVQVEHYGWGLGKGRIFRDACGANVWNASAGRLVGLIRGLASLSDPSLDL